MIRAGQLIAVRRIARTAPPPSVPRKNVAVFAGNREQFVNHFSRVGTGGFKDGTYVTDEVVYRLCRDVPDIAGRDFDSILRIGSWWRFNSVHDLLAMIRKRSGQSGILVEDV